MTDCPHLPCDAVAHTWGRCTLTHGHEGWHRAAFDGGRRWPSSLAPILAESGVRVIPPAEATS